MKTALNTIVQAAGEYTPTTFGTDLAGGAATILPWVGTGVAGGVALMFVFMGIKKGLGFFRSTAK